jgi:hypothetical protein
MKITIAEEHRANVRKLFVDVLGASVKQPMPALDAYALEDGFVGVEFVPTASALSTEDHRKGTWLEFLVSNPSATARQLDAAGVSRIEYADPAHAYFQIPGGPVFRLAAAT